MSHPDDSERRKADNTENRLCDFTSTKFGEMQIIEGDVGTGDRAGGEGRGKLNGGVRGISEMMDVSHDLGHGAW